MTVSGRPHSIVSAEETAHVQTHVGVIIGDEHGSLGCDDWSWYSLPFDFGEHAFISRHLRQPAQCLLYIGLRADCNRYESASRVTVGSEGAQTRRESKC